MWTMRNCRRGGELYLLGGHDDLSPESVAGTGARAHPSVRAPLHQPPNAISQETIICSADSLRHEPGCPWRSPVNCLGLHRLAFAKSRLQRELAAR